MRHKVKYWRLIFAGTFTFISPLSAAADAELQRQLLRREQQQLELRLKMQQQHDRALQPPSALALPQQRQLDRDQLQRLEQANEQQLRGTIASETAEAPVRDSDRRRGLETSTEQLNRFETERRAIVNPVIPDSPPATSGR